jgi:hypothetical protein
MDKCLREDRGLLENSEEMVILEHGRFGARHLMTKERCLRSCVYQWP